MQARANARGPTKRNRGQDTINVTIGETTTTIAKEDGPTTGRSRGDIKAGARSTGGKDQKVRSNGSLCNRLKDRKATGLIILFFYQVGSGVSEFTHHSEFGHQPVSKWIVATVHYTCYNPIRVECN